MLARRDMPFTRIALKRALHGIRKRASGFALLALVFLFVAEIQHSFVRHQIYETIASDLSSWANEIAREIAYVDRWDLKGYRQASVTVPSWYVVTKSGLIVDVEGLVPGLFGRVSVL